MQHTLQPGEKILLKTSPPRRALWYWATNWSIWSEMILISSFIALNLRLVTHITLDFEFLKKFFGIKPGLNPETAIFSLKYFLIVFLFACLFSKILSSRYYIILTNQRVLTRRNFFSDERSIPFEEILDIRTEPYWLAVEKLFKLKSIDINNSKSFYRFRNFQSESQKKFCHLDALTSEQYKAILEILLPKIQMVKIKNLKKNISY